MTQAFDFFTDVSSNITNKQASHGIVFLHVYLY